ncbi:MAG TPA: hypothetical protein VJT67_10140 [Longimicrobiaceae bacterium]|nr:hypothetical protein [Longimicrobiaceae bacterium]
MVDEKIAPGSASGIHARRLLAKLASEAGWSVHPVPDRAEDLIIARGNVIYYVQVKTASEGRSDRLVPLWAQAFLQTLRAAGASAMPLAVVAAPRVPQRVADQVLDFAAEYAPAGAAGVMDLEGHSRFRGDFLGELNRESAVLPRALPMPAPNLFSDANQWMLKVLLAPELPENLLAAPRGRYANASQLARAAGVSVMSASRLVRLLNAEGYLHESKPHLELVRRDELFRSWRNAIGARRARELPLRLVRGGDREGEARRLAAGEDACLALFAAADALGFGFVSGVPPYLYVRRLEPRIVSGWKEVVVAREPEQPDLFVREAPAPSSVFSGAVRRDGALACDIIQVWLDVASHPTRGEEQADLIQRKVLAPLIGLANDE